MNEELDFDKEIYILSYISRYISILIIHGST